ncbi:hypothetical protein GCM10018954_037140 [Kutzneria kofuensis]|uniref:hypothetical protein n=1 Tax=Kutzneria kofuensis TaxID=103725 RepID=UPI0016204730|nr:hypothetical protein [Kutzneria kofuensis]
MPRAKSSNRPSQLRNVTVFITETPSGAEVADAVATGVDTEKSAIKAMSSLFISVLSVD